MDARAAGEKIVEYVDGGKGVQRDKQANYFKYLPWKHFGIDSLMEKSWDFDRERGVVLRRRHAA